MSGALSNTVRRASRRGIVMISVQLERDPMVERWRTASPNKELRLTMELWNARGRALLPCPRREFI